MECFDIIDEKGNLTGEVKTRDEVHKKGLCHRTIFVWIINSMNELLMKKEVQKKTTIQICGLYLLLDICLKEKTA
jgi:isopentenyldiphosphate isomerase